MSRFDWSKPQGKEEIVAGMDVPFATLDDLGDHFEQADSKIYAQLPDSLRLYENKYQTWSSILLDGNAYAWYQAGNLDGQDVSLMLKYYPLKTEALASSFFKQSADETISLQETDQAGRDKSGSLVFRIGKKIYILNIIADENSDLYEKKYIALAKE